LSNHRLEGNGARRALGVSFCSGALFVRRQDAMRRQALDGERAGDADAFRVLVRLVVQEFGFGVAGDGRVNLLARHPLADVGVVGDGFERHVRDATIDEASADVSSWELGVRS
jgi:hypothetical protein